MIIRLALTFFLASVLVLSAVAGLPSTSNDSLSFTGNESFRLPLLNQSFFSYDRLCSPFVYEPFQPISAGDFRFGINAYDNLISRKPALLQLDTNSAVSEISLVLGSKREQLLYLDHLQKVSKYMKGRLAYNSIVSPGFLLNSLARYQQISTGLDFARQRVLSSFNFKYNRLSVDENGGILPGQNTSGLSLSEFEQLNTFLPDDRRLIRNWELKSSSRFMIAGAVDSNFSFSAPGLFFGLDAAWKRYGTSYTGQVDTSFYPIVFNDSLNTADSSGFTFFNVAPSLTWRFRFRDFQMCLTSGLSLVHVNSFQNGLKQSSGYSSPFVSVSGSVGRLEVDLQLETVLGDWFNQGDFSWSSTWRYKRLSRFLHAWSGSFQQRRIAPGLLTLEYSANQFRWLNDFLKENYVSGSTRFDFWKGRFSFSVDAVQVARWVYMNESAVPVQATERVSILKSSLLFSETWRNWNFSFSLLHASLSGAPVRYPEWSYWSKVSYKASFFKKALKSEVGLSAYGTDAFEAMGFMPITGERFLQSGFRSGGAPVIDAFFHAGIGSATLSLVVQRVNDGIFGGEYFVVPGYPAPPRTFKFVLRWRLFN